MGLRNLPSIIAPNVLTELVRLPILPHEVLLAVEGGDQLVGELVQLLLQLLACASLTLELLDVGHQLSQVLDRSAVLRKYEF